MKKVVAQFNLFVYSSIVDKIKTSVKGARMMGMITVYTGPMFSRKTAFLLAELERSAIAERTTAVFKPIIDGRFGEDVVKSRNAGATKAVCISNLSELQNYDAQDYFIDEFQFLQGDIQIIQNMANAGKTFYISGLDMTAEGKPFAIMRDLLCIADIVEKRKAICIDCKCGHATHSFFLGDKKEDIRVGDNEYIALCRRCWAKRMEQKNSKK